jgi:hypothetical protein
MDTVLFLYVATDRLCMLIVDSMLQIKSFPPKRPNESGKNADSTNTKYANAKNDR